MVINTQYPEFITLFSLFYKDRLVAIRKVTLTKLKIPFISTLEGEGKVK